MQIGEELGIAKLYERINCNLCGRDDTELLLNIRGLPLSLEKASFNIVRCKNCGLVYVNPRLSGSELTRLYKDMLSG
jgi:uncharacterized Zn finger protein